MIWISEGHLEAVMSNGEFVSIPKSLMYVVLENQTEAPAFFEAAFVMSHFMTSCTFLCGALDETGRTFYSSGFLT